jgi:hypothetical protein
MPCWLVLGIFIVGCGRTEREYQAEPSSSGSGGDDGSGSGGADSSEEANGTGGAAGGSNDTEPGAAGQPATGTEPDMDPAQETEPEQPPETDPPVVYPSDCTLKSLTVKDPNTGITWATVYVCGNDGGAGVYEKPNYNDKVGIMNSTNSWFVCWKAGTDHAGKNNIWYYTQGSVSTAGWGGRAAWGFMPAINVYTDHDPDSAIPPCSF